MSEATPGSPLSAEEIDRLVDDLTAEVEPGRHHEVLAWALWGLPPWTSWESTISLLHERLRDRHGGALTADPGHEALTQLTMGRLLLTGRRWPLALEVAEDSAGPARASDKATLVRFGRALEVRARLNQGAISEAFEAVRGGALKGLDRDPDEFAAEGHLALGLTALVAGKDGVAVQHLRDARTAALAHDREELGAWQAARAEVGVAHAAFRLGRPLDAVQQIDAASERARAQDAVGELADWQLLRAGYALANGEPYDADAVRQAVEWAGLLDDRSGAVDLLAGLPFDISATDDPKVLSRRARAALEHRAETRDPYGFALTALTGVAVLAAHDQPDEARGILGELTRLLDRGADETLARMATAAREAFGDSSFG